MAKGGQTANEDARSHISDISQIEETVRVIRVFVSSPDDVTAEREALEKVCASINWTEGQAQGFRLELFR